MYNCNITRQFCDKSVQFSFYIISIPDNCCSQKLNLKKYLNTLRKYLCAHLTLQIVPPECCVPLPKMNDSQLEHQKLSTKSKEM